MFTERQFGIWKTAEADGPGVRHAYNSDIAEPHAWHERRLTPLVGMLMEVATSSELDPAPNPSNESEFK